MVVKDSIEYKIMAKGFSSKLTEYIYNEIIKYNLTGEQFCELANRLTEYGKDLIYQRHKKKIEEFNTRNNSIYDKIRISDFS